MPFQNRVTPFGEIVAIPERGTLLGIRGILHDATGRIRRRWAGPAWISCHLEFRGRRATRCWGHPPAWGGGQPPRSPRRTP